MKYQYKIVKSKPFIKDLQKTLDEWVSKGWEPVSHAANSGTAGHTFIFRKK